MAYTHSLPIRNGDKFWWVRFLYFPVFWMVFVSYFPNFLWSPFLIFFIYFFEKHKFILITKKILIFLLITILLLSDLNEFFCELSAFGHLFEYFIHFLVVNKKIVSYFEKFNGLLFLMIEEFDGSFLIRAFLIERECVYQWIRLEGKIRKCLFFYSKIF